MVHKEQIDHYDGTLEQLAHEIGDLRYDALATFLRSLASKLASDGAADENRRHDSQCSSHSTNQRHLDRSREWLGRE